MTLDAIRRTKHETWCSGVEAFADYVHKAFQLAREGCEANDMAEIEPPSWPMVAQRLAQLETQMMKGRDYVFTLSPFIVQEIPPKVEAGIYRAFGAQPKTTVAKDE